MKAHIDSCLPQINDVDDEGYTAMHYAARYNRVSVMEVLFAAGAGECVTSNDVFFNLFRSMIISISIISKTFDYGALTNNPFVASGGAL